MLSVTLEARPEKIRIGDLEVEGDTYNGLYAGPVLRLRPGDLLKIHLINHLAEPTNIHFHGMQTSPLFNSDNVHIAVPAGQSFDYAVRIPPTQPPGLYWYHSHVHGISEHQVMGGLSGALVIEGLTEQFPELAGIAERVFVLKDMAFDDDTGDARIDDEDHGLIQSINGGTDVAETLRPGETQLWRFSNQSANRYFHIALAGHPFRVIADDGEATLSERATDTLDIKPASRVEVLVTGGAPGTYELLSTGVTTGTGAAVTDHRVLGHVVVAGDTGKTIPPLATFPAQPDLRGVPIQASRSVVFSQTTTLDPAKQRYFVNGRQFDADRVDIRVPLGNVEEWTIRNDSDDLHVFHIHQLAFQVLEVDGVPAEFNGRVDTVRVPERGTVKIRLAFTDPLILGRFMYHCHVLRHEDRGMMAQIEVYDPRAQGAADWFARFMLRVWAWWNGVPWVYCGLA